MAASALDTAAKLFEHIQAKNVEGVGALYADDVEVWHNFDDAIQTKAENLKTLEGLTKAVHRITYHVIERHDLGGRIVQRHNLECRTADGNTFVIPACIFITVADGRITRIDEYLDSAQANALRAATGRPRL